MQDNQKAQNNSQHERNVIWYELNQPEQTTEALSVDEEEPSTFVLTSTDVAAMQRDLTDKMNKQLVFLPKKFVDEKDRQLKEQAWKKTIIRFKLLGKWVIQANFSSEEQANALHTFIRDIFATEKFDLLLVRKKLANDDNRNLIEAGIAPKSLVIVSFPDVSSDSLNSVIESFLYQTRKCSHEEADKLSSEWLNENSTFRSYLNDASTHFQERLSTNVPNVEQPGPDEYKPSPSLQRQREGPPLPKWLKLK